MRPRLWVSLALGVGVALVVYHWPPAPRLELRGDHICWHLAFAHDGTKLAVLDRVAGLNAPGQVLVWDVATGALLYRWDYGTRLYPSQVIFAPDDRSLGLLDAGCVVRRDLGADRVVAEYDHATWTHDPDRYPSLELLFAPTGRWLMHDAREGRVFDVESGQVVHDYQARLPDRSPYAYGGCLAAHLQDKIATFDAVTGKEVGTLPASGKGGTLKKGAWIFSADGSHALCEGSQGRWVIGNLVTGRHCTLGAIEGMGYFRFSADNRFLAASSGWGPGGVLDGLRRRLLGQRLHVFDTTTGAEVCPPIRNGAQGYFAPDGKTLAATDRSNRIALWDWPPRSRWPLVLALGAGTTALIYGVGRWQHRPSPIPDPPCT